MTWTRVRDKDTGYHISVPVVRDNHEVLKDHDAVDRNGNPLPPKYSVESKGSTTKKAADK